MPSLASCYLVSHSLYFDPCPNLTRLTAGESPTSLNVLRVAVLKGRIELVILTVCIAQDDKLMASPLPAKIAVRHSSESTRR